MLRQLVNEAVFDLRLDSITPLLIKAGKEASVLDSVDMQPVVTFRSGEAVPYIPGSSAKGVLRSHAERIARTLAGAQHPERGACNPFERQSGRPDQSCSERLKVKGGTPGAGARAYGGSCPICKLFGSLSLLSRCEIADFYVERPEDKPRRERRDGVGIDRVSGGASSGALFNLEVAVGGRYTGTVRVRNFELWQLGLLAFVLRDLADGELTFGMGSSRGLGQVRAELLGARVRLFGLDLPENRLTGLARLGGALTAEYGFSTNPAETAGIPAGIPGEADMGGLGRRFVYTGPDAVRTLLAAAAPAFPAYMRTVAERGPLPHAGAPGGGR